MLRQVTDQSYILSMPNRRKTTQPCHVNLLKPYYVRESKPFAAPDDGLLRGRLKNSESLENLTSLLAHLSEEHRAQLSVLIQCYPGLFGDTPSRTHLVKHDIDVGDAHAIRQRFYRVSEEKCRVVDAEIQYMLENGITEPSSSS